MPFTFISITNSTTLPASSALRDIPSRNRSSITSVISPSCIAFALACSTISFANCFLAFCSFKWPVRSGLILSIIASMSFTSSTFLSVSAISPLSALNIRSSSFNNAPARLSRSSWLNSKSEDKESIFLKVWIIKSLEAIVLLSSVSLINKDISSFTVLA